MKTIKYASLFRSEAKKVHRNKRWKPIFNEPLPIEVTGSTQYQGLAPFDFVVALLQDGQPLPSYFYVHPLTLPRKTRANIARALNKSVNEVQCLELHFDGHNGDHLLVYSSDDDANILYLIAIGTHSDIFG